MSRTSTTPAGICDDRVCRCGTCRAVDYDRMRRSREAAERRERGGPGRPAWWEGCEQSPSSRSATGGRVTPALMADY